jgi:hypothetical protein
MYLKNLIKTFKKTDRFICFEGDIEYYMKICNLIQGKRIKTRFISEPCGICACLDCEVVSITDLQTKIYYYVACSKKKIVIVNTMNSTGF